MTVQAAGRATGPAVSGALRRNRWAISFADLCLLLLGFFVLLQANSGRQKEIIQGVAQQFGAPVGKEDSLPATALFQPGEALLTPKGAAQISALAKRYGGAGVVVEIRSVGVDRSANRFDEWDLAAARLGAVARALVQAGVARDAIVIRGLDDEGRVKGATGQYIILSHKVHKSGQ